MDAADATQLYGLLFTVVLPVASVIALALLGRRFWPGLPVLGLAIVGASVVAWLGIAGLPNGSQNAVHYAILVAVPFGLRPSILSDGRGRALIGGLAFAIGLYLCLSPLAKIWEPGVASALAESWILDAGLMGLITLIALSHAAERAPAPVIFGPLALTFAAAAGVCVLSHSALLGQLLGGVGIVIGVAALVGWKTDLQPSPGGIAFGVLLLTLLLAFGHFTTQVPRSAGALLVLTPAVALVGLRFERTLIATLVVSALAAAPAGLAVWLTQEKIEAAKPATDGVPEIDYGSMYGG